MSSPFLQVGEYIPELESPFGSNDFKGVLKYSLNFKKNYIVRYVPSINRVSTNTGTTAGQLVSIYPFGYDSGKDLKVYVGGLEAKIKKKLIDQVEI